MTAPVIADDLITAFAKTVLWVCERHGANPAEARATAAEACRDICKHWGGDKHWIPAIYRPARNAEILHAVRQGIPVRVISQQLDVCEMTVRRLVRKQSAGLGSDDWVL